MWLKVNYLDAGLMTVEVTPPFVPSRAFVLEPEGSSGNNSSTSGFPHENGHAHRY